MKKRLKINGIIMACAAIIVVFFPRFFFRNNVNGGIEEYIELLGLSFILLGQIIRVSARGYKAEHSCESQALIQGGPYQVVRNPMYLGIFLIGLGVVLAVFKWWVVVIFIIVFVIRYIMLIYKEERRLLAVFPGSYKDYCKKVPRILPSLFTITKLDISEYLPIKLSWFKKEIGSILTLLLLTLLVESWEDIVRGGFKVYVRQSAWLFLTFALFIIFVILLSSWTYKKMEALQIKAKIISNKKLKSNYWHLEFESGSIAKNAAAGQFVDIKVNDSDEPLLRRPISIHSVSGTKVKLIYEVIGNGTQILSGRIPGGFLNVIGPLGNGFEYSRLTKKSDKRKNILVAGGMGVAPLVFLVEKIKFNRPLVLIGARKKEHILCSQEFKTLGCKVIIATDDGSLGFKGKVTELLKEVLLENQQISKPDNIYACGPQLMLKAVARIACENNIDSQLSLEEHMACGIGACLGCVVSTQSGYKRVCKDGPVFLGKELTW